MQDYLSVEFQILEEAYKDILVAELSQIAFDHFWEQNEGLTAYILKENFDRNLLEAVSSKYCEYLRVKKIRQTENINWNETWERSFEPVVILDQIVVRADFHEPLNLPLEIVITPKMAFGTGHHETTSLMLEQMLTLDFNGMQVLDNGCGTAILAIAALKMGAAKVSAIDNDPNAIDNARENIRLNNTEDIIIEKGEVPGFPEQRYDILLCNINKNVLKAQLGLYQKYLKKDGRLLMSGILIEDETEMIDLAEKKGLQLMKRSQKNQWILLDFSA